MASETSPLLQGVLDGAGAHETMPAGSLKHSRLPSWYLKPSRRPSQTPLGQWSRPLVLIVLILFVFYQANSFRNGPPLKIPLVKGPFDLPLSIARNLGPYTPWFSMTDGHYQVPRDCRVDQVHILQRHGARYPTLDAGFRIRTAIDKLRKVERFNSPVFDFFQTWEYTLGIEDLLPYGAKEFVGLFSICRKANDKADPMTGALPLRFSTVLF